MKVKGWGVIPDEFRGSDRSGVVLAGPQIGFCGVGLGGPAVGGRDSAGFGPRGVGAGGCRRVGGVPGGR